MLLRSTIASTFAFLLTIASLHAADFAKTDWPHWRGPNNNNVAVEGQTPPTNFGPSSNVLWKTPIPGRGHSTPTIVGDKIFLATADEDRKIQGVIAFDRKTGKQAWIKEISRGGFPPVHPKNTYASGTIAASPDQLFITFHHDDLLTLASLDHSGKPLWSIEAGPYAPRVYEYGYAPSPLLYKNMVIIAADYEKGGYLAAFDQKTGKQVWKTQRPNFLSFSSPIVCNVAGKDQLVISGCERVSSYDPNTGKELWSTPGTTMATCGTVVWNDDTIFASGGYPKPQTIAVKADGSNQVLWSNPQKCYEQSMLAHNGYIYAFTDNGILFCWRASDGKEMWKQRKAGPVSASPILVGDNIYATNELGQTWVFKASPDSYQEVAENKLGDESFASLVIADSKIYTRIAVQENGKRQEYLYCFGQ